MVCRFKWICTWIMTPCMALFVRDAFSQHLPDFHQIPQNLKESRQYERIEWFALQRLYPFTEDPSQALFRSWTGEDIVHRPKKPVHSTLRTASWVSKGPSSVMDRHHRYHYSGRVRGMAVHPDNPDIVYIGAASGGIWKTMDGGFTWIDLSAELASLTFGAITIDPFDPDVIYAGTGEAVAGVQNYIFDGRGLFKSTDGGLTFDRITDDFGVLTAFADLCISPHDPDLLLAGLAEGYVHARNAMDNSGVWRSTDGGLTWQTVLPLYYHSGNGAYEVAFHPLEPSLAYAAIGDANTFNNQAGFYVSSDSGLTWEKKGAGLPDDITRMQFAQAKQNPSVFYGLVYHHQYNPYKTRLYRSEDSGTTWIQISNETDFGSGGRDQGFYDLCVNVSPVNTDFCLAGNILLRLTRDGGTLGDYIRDVHVDNHIIRFSGHSPNVVYVGCDGGVWRSSDNGETWEDRNTGLSTLQLYAMAGHPTDKNEIIAGSQDNWSFMTRDGGVSAWVQLPLGGDIYGICYDSQTPSHFYCLTGISVYKTTDSGTQFTKVTPELGAYAYAREPAFCMHPSNSRILTLPSRKIWRSTDAGETWTALTGDVFPYGVTAMAQSLVNPDLFLAATRPVPMNNDQVEMMLSTDGGAYWQEVPGTLPGEARYISKVVFHPGEAGTFFAVQSGYGSGKIFRTRDLGNTWEDVSGNLPDIPHSDLFLDPENPDIYITANDFGVYGSPDAGISWTRLDNGMPRVVALDFDYFHHEGERLLRVATYGRGVFEMDLDDLVIETFVEEGEENPRDRALLGNYPNPFNPLTTVTYTLNRREHVSLSVYDLIGRLKVRLVDSMREAGEHAVEFHAGQLPGGIYFVRLQTGGRIKVIKIVVMK